jgi:trans-aconitate methyltransferase
VSQLTVAILELIFVGILLFVLISIVISYLRTGVPTVASARAAQRVVSTFLRDSFGSRQVRIFELGSGKGDFVLQLARDLPDAQVTGYEISLPAFLLASILKRLSSVKKRVSFVLGDFRKINLSSADAVVMYLMPQANRKLAPKLMRELRAGTWVISVSFSFPMWVPHQVLQAQNFSRTRVFVYRMPAVPASTDLR